MTTYFIDASRSDDTGDGLSWATAKKTFGAGFALATTAGDLVKIHYQHTETITAAKTYAFAANNVAVICVDKDNADALATMDGTNYNIGGNAAYGISISGAYKGFMYGIAFRVNADMYVAKYDGAHQTYEKCKFWFGTGSNYRWRLGDGVSQNAYVHAKECGVKFGHSTQSFSLLGAHAKLEGVYIESGSAVPGYVWGDTTVYTTRATVVQEGCDYSLVSTILVSGASTAHAEFVFVNCRLHASVTKVSAITPANQSAVEAWFFNCASGDVHCALEHINALGSTVVDTGIYVNDNPTYDGINKCSWKIVTTTAANFYAPYISPWIDRAFIAAATPAAINPYLECLRDGSATAFQNDEVWPEFSYQGTSGYPLASFASGRMTLLGTPADLTASSKGASDWTGENATAWFGKLTLPASITPQEAGHLRARICVGEPNTTLYVDPTIRLV